MFPAVGAHIEFAARGFEDFGHFGHSGLGFGFGLGVCRDEGGGGLVLLGGEIPHFLTDFHRTEFGAAHGAEMGGFCPFGGEGLVVVIFRRVRIEREVELVAPAKFKAGLG